MHLINLTGNFSIDTLEKVVLGVKVLVNQPLLEVHEIYADKNPEFRYRTISVDNIYGLKYHVSDMGRVEDVPSIVSLASKIYSEEDVEKLRRHD